MIINKYFGCTDETAFNYDENATSLPTGEIIPGGSCNLEIWDGNYFGIDPDWYFDGNQNTFATGNKLYIGGNTFYVEYVSEIQENCNAPAVLVYVVTNPDGTSDGPVYVDAVVGENWYMDPCGVAVDGCTDSTADNFNEYATNDDGSCCYGSLATMGGSWYGLEQTSWSIINCNGQVIASASGDVNGDGSTYTVCVGVLPNSYEVVTGDTNGNGWNGNVLTIDGQVFSGPPQACASEYHPVFNPNGYNCTASEQVGSCSGCTDLQACNYSPNATFSDPNSCIYPTSGFDCYGNSLCDGTWIEDISYGNCSDYSLDECSSIVGLYGTSCDVQGVFGSGFYCIGNDLLENGWDLVLEDNSYCDGELVDPVDPVSCVTLTLMDSFGDGGGSITVGGQTFTLNVGSSSAIFYLCNLDLTTCNNVTYAATDAFSYENSWEIADSDGNVIASGADENGLVGDCDGNPVLGCVDATSCNYNPNATQDDGSCTYAEEGYDCNGDAVFSLCEQCAESGGFYCGDDESNWTQYAPNGCVIPSWINDNYNDCIDGTDEGNATPTTNCGDENPILGCVDATACNYDPLSNTDDGSCIYAEDGYDCDGNPLEECVNDDSVGDSYGDTCSDWYDANPDGCGSYDTDTFTASEMCCACGGGSAPVLGCVNDTACNYNPNATQDDGSCEFPNNGFDCDGNVIEVLGCTDETACNYEPIATEDDGSCEFASNGYDCDGNCEWSETTISYSWDGSGQTQNSWVITNENGDIIWEDEGYAWNGGWWWFSNSPPSINVCIDPNGCYDFVLSDSAGNGWNGNSLNFNNSSTNISFTMVNGAIQTYSNCYSCTDQTACNFNGDPSAISDNDYCIYATEECEACTGEFDGSGSVILNDEDEDGVCNEDEIEGCTDELACNYEPLATDPGTCDFSCYDCMDESACNYNSGEEILEDNSLCVYPVNTCDTCSGESDGTGTVVDNDIDNDGICDLEDSCPNDPENDADGDGICESDEVFGCTDINACNYNTLATEDNNSCTLPVNCDTCSGESDGTGTIVDNDIDNDGVCDDDEVLGCQDMSACNYDDLATDDNGSCSYPTETYLDCNGYCLNDNDEDSVCDELEVFGCTDSTAFNYDLLATEDDDSCIPVILGCIDSLYLEFNSSANTDDGSCVNLIIEGCTNDSYLEFNSSANTDDGSCSNLIILGCTDESYFEYDSAANTDDGSCSNLIVLGCTDESYFEYDSAANTDDGSCSNLIVLGCTDSNAANYNSLANTDDDSCEFSPFDVTQTDCNMTVLLPDDLQISVNGETPTSSIWIGVTDSEGIVCGEVLYNPGEVNSVVVWDESDSNYGMSIGETLNWAG